MQGHWWIVMAAIAASSIWKQLWETFPITWFKEERKQSPEALCLSIHPSTDPLVFFLHVPESIEGIPQGSVHVTIFPACAAINQAAAVSAEDSDYSALVFTRPPHFSQTRQDALIYSVLQVSNWKAYLFQSVDRTETKGSCKLKSRLTQPSLWANDIFRKILVPV